MANKLEPEWNRLEKERLSRANRKNAIGQGHPYFGNFNDMLLLLILYTRTNCGNVLLGLILGMTEKAVIELSQKLLPLLQDNFVPKTKLNRKRRGTINTLDDLIAAYPEIADVIVDGISVKTRRPKRKQGKNYSGKNKRHEKKSVIVVNSKDGLILGRTNLRPGSVHDKRVLDEDNLHKYLDKNHNLVKRADSAWTGESAAHGWLVNERGRRNHPLTDKQKKNNKRLSRTRIVVEHAIRRIKIFRRIGETAYFRTQAKLDSVFNVAINLANFKQIMRFSVGA